MVSRKNNRIIGLVQTRHHGKGIPGPTAEQLYPGGQFIHQEVASSGMGVLDQDFLRPIFLGCFTDGFNFLSHLLAKIAMVSSSLAYILPRCYTGDALQVDTKK